MVAEIVGSEYDGVGPGDLTNPFCDTFDGECREILSKAIGMPARRSIKRYIAEAEKLVRMDPLEFEARYAPMWRSLS